MPDLDLSVGSGDVLSVRRFEAQEAISELFEVTVLARIENANVDLERIVGQPATLRVTAGLAYTQDKTRVWSGMCRFVEQTRGLDTDADTRNQSTYRVVIVPSLWALTQRRNNRIYQHLSIPDIVKSLLKEWGIAADWNVDDGKYPPLEYKVQYDESDYAFVSRLLEEAGIAFHFPDESGQARLTFADELQNGSVRSPAIPYVDSPNDAQEAEYTTKLHLTREVRPGGHVLRDYDFRMPGYQLYGKSPTIGAEKRYEQYHHRSGSAWIENQSGGGTPVADDKGTARTSQDYLNDHATRRLEANRTGRGTVQFETNVIGVRAGRVIDIDSHPHADLERNLLMIELTISGNNEGEEWTTVGRAVFSDEPFRPPLRTPRPSIQGVQTAAVVGPKGQEIYCDELGRVRVQFPWDREGKSDDNSSIWMRVSQGWAGTGFGMINIPRIGQEVLVGFLEGDPDQPLVVGRVFNAVEQVPYKLPENKTVSGWKTNSSPGGGGYNEIKLEDKAGLELFYVQAQRNYDELIKNDETERTIGNHRKTVVENQDLVVKQTKKELVEGDDHLHVNGSRMQKIDGSTALTVGADQHEKIGNLHAMEAGKEIHLKAGDKVVIEAGTRLTIKGPGGFVDIHAGGVDIKGVHVNINSGGSAGSGSGASPTEPTDAAEAEPRDHS